MMNGIIGTIYNNYPLASIQKNYGKSPFSIHYNKIQEKRALQGGAPQWPLKPDI